MTTYVTFTFNYSGTQTFTIPNDMNWNNFTVECIGGGGMGGGAYAATTNGTFSFPNGYGPGATIPLTVGYPTVGSVINSWFGSTTYGSAMCAAESGFFGDGASGGRAAYSIGNVKYSGGNGGSGLNGGGGGGGAAGPHGNGGNGGNPSNYCGGGGGGGDGRICRSKWY